MSDKKLTEMEIFTSAVYNALRVGHKNARTRRELCEALGCSDRALRDRIKKLREKYTILTRDDGKGYYLPEKTDAGFADVKRWKRRQQHRINEIMASLRGAELFLNERRKEPKGIYGQISMFRDGGQDGDGKDAERERKARRA